MRDGGSEEIEMGRGGCGANLGSGETRWSDLILIAPGSAHVFALIIFNS